VGENCDQRERGGFHRKQTDLAESLAFSKGIPMKRLGFLLVVGLLIVGWMNRDKLSGLPAAVGNTLNLRAAATPHPAREAQVQAAARYPGLAIPNSALNKKFVALYKEAQATDPALLSRPVWPFELAERAVVSLGGAPMPRSAPKAPAPQARAVKSVVIYTTSNCPVCKQAKQYFTQKGVPYREIDIETSQGKSEFRRNGGTGTPLIMVGSTKVDGFDAGEMDRLLF
jgi:glutaredoxin